MPGYEFSVSLTLENKDDKELVIRILRGSLLEPSSTSRTQQSAVVKQDYIFRLNPHEVRPVLIDAECWNERLAPPNKASGKITPFLGKVQKTTDVWGVSARRPDATQIVSPFPKPQISELIAQVGGEWASEALKFAIEQRSKRDPAMMAEGLALKREIETAGTDGGKLRAAVAQATANYRINGADLRAWLISSGSLFDRATQRQSITALTDFVALLYSNNTHDLSEELYLVAAELRGLRDDLANAITDKTREELEELIKRKSLTILAALPEVDKVYNPPLAA